jgi:hypothetical protein
VYLAGNFNGTVNFAGGMPANNIASNGGTDNFILKLDSSGSRSWIKTFGGASAEFISSLAFDTSGNVFSTGYFNGTVDFDSSAATYNLTANNTDVFILKLNSSGNFVNASRFGGSGNEVGNFIKVDASNKIITTGTFNGNCYFNPNSSSTDNVVSAGSDDGFVHKMMDPTLGTGSFSVTEKTFSIYPNPNNGQFNIDVKEDATVSITNMLGQLIVKQKLSFGNNEINLQDKPNGIYFVTVNDDSKHTFKMVKQ